MFVTHVIEECQGSGYAASMGAAFNSDDPQMPKVVHKTAQGILRLIQWPATQVEALKGSVDDE